MLKSKWETMKQSSVCWTLLFAHLKGLQVIALKRACKFWRVTLALPGCLVGSAFFLSGLKFLFIILQQLVATSAAWRRETFFASGFHMFFLVWHSDVACLLNIYSLPEYFCMTWYKKCLAGITSHGVLYSISIPLRGDDTCDTFNSNRRGSLF